VPAIEKIEETENGALVTYKKGRALNYSKAERETLLAQAKAQIALGKSYSEAARDMHVATSTLYGWLKRDGLALGGGGRDRRRQKRVQPTTPAKRLPMLTDPKPGLAMVAVDLHQFVVDNRLRIVRELCLGKTQAIKTAVEELTKPSPSHINPDAEA
jgi:transposase-like protein